jgi:hypothetical protein
MRLPLLVPTPLCPMPPSPRNPAIQAFIDSLQKGNRFGQTVIITHDDEYEIRHYLDESQSADSLQTCSSDELREIVATDTNQEFRPLKSAPDLRRGWRTWCSTPEDLWARLNTIYPGAIGDAFAVSESGTAKIVSYRSFVGRQSGMYRGASKLSQSEADRLATTCCSSRHCIKERLWRIEETPNPPILNQPKLVCLEPCQILLELARRESKSKQEPSLNFELRKNEALALLENLKTLGVNSATNQRTADFSNSHNPRRIDLLRDRIESQFTRQTEELGE